MDIKMNRYMRQASYTAAAGERTSESHAGGKVESEVKTGTNRDTVSISVADSSFSLNKWNQLRIWDCCISVLI